MGWKSKMYIFANLLGQVNRLSSVELLLQSEGLDGQLGLKFVQTGHTFQTDTHAQTPGRKKPAEIGRASCRERVCNDV